MFFILMGGKNIKNYFPSILKYKYIWITVFLFNSKYVKCKQAIKQILCLLFQLSDKNMLFKLTATFLVRNPQGTCKRTNGVSIAPSMYELA